MRKICILLLVLLLAGCRRNQSEQDTSSPPPISLDSLVEFTVPQRSTIFLPKSDNKFLLTLDDITGGHVLITLSRDDGEAIVPMRSTRQNDIVSFTIGEHTYKLKLKQLTNLVIGEDFALFQLWPATVEMERLLPEQDKIEKLISSLQQLSDAKFIRNDQEYTVHEAVAHMKMKWEWKRAEIKTAVDFITIAASKSSVSGEPYLIELSDGTVLKSEEWFRKQLDLINESSIAPSF